jgi:membrane protein
VKELLRIPRVTHRAVVRAIDHGILSLAQASAYSAIVALFPALIVAAALIALLPHTAPVRAQLGGFFERVLPPAVMPVLEGYFATAPHTSKSTHVVAVSVFVSVTGASSVIATFMEGFRRAYDLPFNCWTFFRRRGRAYALVPLSLIPLAIASSLIVFGHFLILWIAFHVPASIRTEVYVLALIIRWSIALTGSAGLIAVIYHMGTPIRQPWKQVLPGAIAATVMWFLTTLAFGWYVTRFANYSQVYGSLGAGIALLFWLYIVSLSVLFGAEFNYSYRQHQHA